MLKILLNHTGKSSKKKPSKLSSSHKKSASKNVSTFFQQVVGNHLVVMFTVTDIDLSELVYIFLPFGAVESYNIKPKIVRDGNAVEVEFVYSSTVALQHTHHLLRPFCGFDELTFHFWSEDLNVGTASLERAMDPDNVAGLDPDTNFIVDTWFSKFMQKPGFVIIRLSGWDLDWDLADWAIILQESVLPFYL